MPAPPDGQGFPGPRRSRTRSHLGRCPIDWLDGSSGWHLTQSIKSGRLARVAPLPGRDATRQPWHGARKAGPRAPSGRGSRPDACNTALRVAPDRRNSRQPRFRVAQHAGQQPDDGVKQHDRGNRTVGQDVIANGNFIGHQRFDHAVVHALVVPAQDDEVIDAASRGPWPGSAVSPGASSARPANPRGATPRPLGRTARRS